MSGNVLQKAKANGFKWCIYRHLRAKIIVVFGSNKEKKIESDAIYRVTNKKIFLIPLSITFLKSENFRFLFFYKKLT